MSAAPNGQGTAQGMGNGTGMNIKDFDAIFVTVLLAILLVPECIFELWVILGLFGF